MPTENPENRDTNNTQYRKKLVNLVLMAILFLLIITGVNSCYGNAYASPADIENALKNAPEECQPIIRLYLSQKIIENRQPLTRRDVRKLKSQIDECELASQQLGAVYQY